jgi:hypothetical protein
MGGGPWKQEPRRGELKALQRRKAQESIGAMSRVTPRRGRRTPARCQALKSSRPADAPGEASAGRRAESRTAKLSTASAEQEEEDGRPTARGLRASRGAPASLGGKSSGGRNPMSVAGMKQGRQGSEGRKPPRGRATLKADRTGQAKPRESGSSVPRTLKGQETSWEAPQRCSETADGCGRSGSEGGPTPRARRTRRLRPRSVAADAGRPRGPRPQKDLRIWTP